MYSPQDQYPRTYEVGKPGLHPGRPLTTAQASLRPTPPGRTQDRLHRVELNSSIAELLMIVYGQLLVAEPDGWYLPSAFLRP